MRQACRVWCAESHREETLIAKCTDNERPAVVVNGRYCAHRITGVQRYAHEIVARLGDYVELCTSDGAKGAAGHLWEQTMLPYACKGRVLWSPCASGPLAYRRQVVTFHDLFPLEFPEWYSSAYAAWYNVVLRRLAKSAAHLIAVSDYTKSRLVNLLGVDPQNITVIYNGAHTTDRASENQIADARKALDLPSGRYVLSLSSLEGRKNLGGILQAWATIHRQVSNDTWLVLSGPRADESVYGKQHLPIDLPRIIFTGYVSEEHLAGLYSGAYLFVFPSFAEGFGLPLVEAMACGVRCVTSRTSSMPEVGGDVVDYVDPRNVAELAHAMLHRLSQNVNVSVPFTPVMERAKLFTWETAASKTREVLDAALAQGQELRATLSERTSTLWN